MTGRPIPEKLLLTPDQLRSPRVRDGVAHWRDLARGRPMPCRRDFDPLAVTALMPHIMLKDIRRDPLDFRYRVVGTTVRHHSSADYTGRWMSDIPHQGPESVVWAVCASVATQAAPILLRPPYAGPQRDFIWLEAAVMPLSDADGNPPAMLLLFIDFLQG